MYQDRPIDNRQSGSLERINLSKGGYTEFPKIQKPNIVLYLNLSKNLIKTLPNMAAFNAIRYIDISSNKFTNLNALESLRSVKEIDCSYNKLTDINFVSNLPTLEVLRASHNQIRDINCILPKNIIDIDLSFNELKNLNFLQTNFPAGIERIEVSGNLIHEIINLRFLPLFQQLRMFNIGLLEENSDIQLLPFVKLLCPSIELFDGMDCVNIEDTGFDKDEIIQVLVKESESELRSFLSNYDGGIKWEEPTFIPFENDVPATPIRKLANRIETLEEKIADPPERITPPKNTGNLLSPYQNSSNSGNIQSLQQELSEIKQQIAQIAEILYVHDKALKQLWEQGPPRNRY